MKKYLRIKALFIGLIFTIIALTGCGGGGGGGSTTPVDRTVGVGVIMLSQSDISLSMTSKSVYSTPDWKRLIYGWMSPEPKWFRYSGLPVPVWI